MTSAANPTEMVADLGNSRGHDGYTRMSHSSGRRSQRVLERASRVVVPQHTSYRPKASIQKSPVDVEKQCGVTLSTGAQCARSLTCKSHSVAAKRAVPSRSLPYDMLLQAYQKTNQAKTQSISIYCQLIVRELTNV
jgi:hypothetical protein